ncbi:MBL fold metallo-hydrolase [Streptomyces sp. DSM 44917]|uniref:MBL fold metallo-hydrolase n=1 Tax=Streptomyces boetiae TaxID=3075541 RepID=A0ABU2LEP4_9ACTN|nr:MBL fold metallo-hydrolase [Streptomyces sp. DSM 44917]MDT0310054.1 MBL fold metallo-hydrolase [Streptomyces sp. DSM 44917]
MKITHYGHACVLAELETPAGPARVLFDPGAYDQGFEELTGLDAVLITHEHPDHLDAGRLAALHQANPSARVLAGPGAAARLAEAGIAHAEPADGARVTVAGAAPVRAVAGEHAVIHPDLPCVPNTGYLLGDSLYHPGDAFTLPPGEVDVLLLPTGGPWMKASEAIDFLRAVAPRVAVPVHQAGLADVHRDLHYHLFRTLGPQGTEVRVLTPGVAAAL